MSIEKIAADLTVALNENTAALKALLAAGGTKAASSTTSTGSTGGEKKESKKETSKPTISRGEVNAALTDVKEKKGAPAAKAIIKDVGEVEKMADIPEDKFQAVYDAAKKAVAEEDGDGI